MLGTDVCKYFSPVFTISSLHGPGIVNIPLRFSMSYQRAFNPLQNLYKPFIILLFTINIYAGAFQIMQIGAGTG